MDAFTLSLVDISQISDLLNTHEVANGVTDLPEISVNSPKTMASTHAFFKHFFNEYLNS